MHYPKKQTCRKWRTLLHILCLKLVLVIILLRILAQDDGHMSASKDELYFPPMINGHISKLTHNIDQNGKHIQKTDSRKYSLSVHDELCYSFDQFNNSLSKTASYKILMKDSLKDMIPSINLILHKRMDESIQKNTSFVAPYTHACWKVTLFNDSRKYQDSKWNTGVWHNRSQSLCVQKQQRDMIKITNVRHSSNDSSGKYKVRCLPQLFLLGMFKAGTTDFYNTLTAHPGVHGGCIKEPGFWLRRKNNNTLSAYLDLYDYGAEKIINTRPKTGNHEKVLIDASSGTFLDYFRRDWQQSPMNKDRNTSCVTLAQHLHYLNPSIKAILLLRHPVDWMTSCYNYYKSFHTTHSTEDLHKQLLKGIKRFRVCMETTSNDIWACFQKSHQGIHDPCKFENSIHYVHVKHWLNILGEDNMMVINSNMYFKDRFAFASQAIQFLGLPPYPDTELKIFNRKRVANQASRNSYVIMRNDTRHMLMNALQPWNIKLGEYLADNSFNWE